MISEQETTFLGNDYAQIQLGVADLIGQGLLAPESGMCRVLFSEFQCDSVDDLFHHFNSSVFEEAEVGSIQGFAVSDRALGRDFEDMSVVKGSDQNFQTTVFVLGRAPSEFDVITADPRTPALFVEHCAVVKSREMIAQFSETVLDMFGQIISQVSMLDAQFFFGRGVCFDGGAVGETRLLPALNSFL